MLKTPPSVPVAEDPAFAEGLPSRMSGGPRPSLCSDPDPPPQAGAVSRSVVQVIPAGSVERRTLTGRAITAELIRSMGQRTIECRYRDGVDLLVAHEPWTRADGETVVEGWPRSTLRDLTRKMTFVPAGHDYFERNQPRTPARIMFFYLDIARYDETVAGASSSTPPGLRLAPRVLFEDATLWNTILKLKGLIEGGPTTGMAYLEALGAVLAHELLQPCDPGGGEANAKGGLAAWQRRLVSSYIEEHLAEQIPLATLAQLARLSPYHFSRAFKRSFGVPPHRYHTTRRIEHAKALLEDRSLSVTEIGLALGFSETSSFSAAFRKTTGLTPTRYHRSVG